MNLFIGVDGGGTKTRAAVVDANSNVCGGAFGGPANAASQPLAVVLESIRASVHGALGAAGVARGDILHFGFGLAGSESPEIRARVQAALETEFGSGRVTLATDARAALAGAILDPRGPGMILIAGTGSAACGRDAAGREARAGGLGWLIGDEGSGFWIARRALEAVARVFDGRGPQTSMVDALRERFDIGSLDRLINHVYGGPPIPGNVASLFPAVAAAARAGDAVALGIFRDAGLELGSLVAAVVEKLNLQKDDVPVAPLGGLWSAGDWLRGPALERAKTVAPGVRWVEAAFPPEVGAARIAMAAVAARGGPST